MPQSSLYLGEWANGWDGVNHRFYESTLCEATMGKYHLAKAKDGEYFWNLRSSNGERILQSEMYSSKASAQSGITSCQENSPHDDRYQRLIANNGQPYFTLRARNNQTIGVSETYSSVQAREAGIASCKANGPSSPVQDDTGEK